MNIYMYVNILKDPITNLKDQYLKDPITNMQKCSFNIEFYYIVIS